MVTWSDALQVFLAGCAAFTCVCVAGGWFFKIVKGVKKPVDDVNDKLQRDFDRINSLDKEIKLLDNRLDYIANAVSILMQCDLVMLGHMKTNNNTGQIIKMEGDLRKFMADNSVHRGDHDE